MNIRTLCLGILSLGESTGYEIKKGIEDGMFSHFIDASFGSIYPALTQLAAEGLLSVRAEEQSGKPDKKVYAITPAGREALASSLSETPGRDKYKSEFLFEMLLQHHMSPEHVERAIMKQHADLTADLNRIAEKRAAIGGNQVPGKEFVMGYGECVLSAAIRYLESKCPALKRSKMKLSDKGLVS
jgi:DNA-binding PadR family transcriptional regulator